MNDMPNTPIAGMTEEQLARSIAIQLVEIKHEQDVLEGFGRSIMRGESVDWKEVKDCVMNLCTMHENFDNSIYRLEELHGQSSEEQADQEAGAGGEELASE